MENLRVMMITAKEAINTLVQTLKKKKKLYIHKRERKFGTEVVTLMLLYWFLWEVETINLFGGESKSGVIWKSFSNFSVLNFFPWKKIVLNAPVNEDTTFLQLCFSLPGSLWVGVSAHFFCLALAALRRGFKMWPPTSGVFFFRCIGGGSGFWSI